MPKWSVCPRTFSAPLPSPTGTVTFSNPPWVMQVSLALFWEKLDDNLDLKQQAFPVAVGSVGRGGVLLLPLHPSYFPVQGVEAHLLGGGR